MKGVRYGLGGESHAYEGPGVGVEDGDSGLDVVCACEVRSGRDPIEISTDQRRDDAVLLVGDDHGAEDQAEVSRVVGPTFGPEAGSRGIDKVGGEADVRGPQVGAGEAFEYAVVGETLLELERHDVDEDGLGNRRVRG